MKFDDYTLKKLEIALEEIDFETNGYDWGTDEYEFLMSLCEEIEDVLRKQGIKRRTY